MNTKLSLSCLIATAFISVSCGTVDPVRESVSNYIKSDLAEGFDKVVFQSFELVDSTTFEQEMDRRIHQFEVKLQADTKLMEKYSAQGKRKNSLLKADAVRNDMRILKELDSLKSVNSALMGSTAYREYQFSAKASGKSASMEFKQAYAAIGNDGSVLNIAAKYEDIHKGMGKVIPGYLEVVGHDSEDNSQPEE